jgi:hypothetical protein
MAEAKGSGIFDRYQHFTLVFFQFNLIETPLSAFCSASHDIFYPSNALHGIDDGIASVESSFGAGHRSSSPPVPLCLELSRS